MNIGFIGLGAMGSRMAANLARGGHRVLGFDLSPAARDRARSLGIATGESVLEASDGQDAVFLSLPGPADVEETVLGREGVLSASRVPSLLIDTTTSLPQVTRRISAAALALGCLVLDAGVSGQPRGAESGTLSIMVGGSEEAFERALPLLRLLGKNIVRAGDVGSGHAAKLVNNAISGTTRAVIAEAFMMGVMAGVDPKVLYDVVGASSGGSRSLQSMLPHLLSGDFSADFPVDLMHKDLDLATQMGQQLGVPMPLVNLGKQAYQAAKTTGLGKLDCSAVAVPLERLMGTEIRQGK